MFAEAIAASDWETVEHEGLEFIFSCRGPNRFFKSGSIILMEVRRAECPVWDNPGPMMPGQIPEMLTQPVLDKLNQRLAKRYGQNPGWTLQKPKKKRKKRRA